jgi:excinuclease UvrABC nuclease subunit
MTQTTLSARIDDDRKVVGYIMVIRDEAERHSYLLPFDQALKTHLQGAFNALPDIGEAVPEDHPEMN